MKKHWVKIIWFNKAIQTIPCKKCNIDNVKGYLNVDNLRYDLSEIKEVYFNELQIY